MHRLAGVRAALAAATLSVRDMFIWSRASPTVVRFELFHAAGYPAFVTAKTQVIDSNLGDDEFIRMFESRVLPNSAFHHRDHLRLAWLYLRRDGAEVGARQVLDGIRRFAVAHGAAHLFHETLTRFWVRLIHHVTATFPEVDQFDDLLSRFPPLTDKTIIYRHYRPETLDSAEARRGWLEPDLLPLP